MFSEKRNNIRWPCSLTTGNISWRYLRKADDFFSILFFFLQEYILGQSKPECWKADSLNIQPQLRMAYFMFHKSLQAIILGDVFPRIFLLLKETFIIKEVKYGGVSYLLTFRVSILNVSHLRGRKVAVYRVGNFCFDFSLGLFPGSRPINKSYEFLSGVLLALKGCQVSSYLVTKLWQKTTEEMEVELSPQSSLSVV